MARDSRGRYAPRLVGSGRRLRMAGAVFDGPEVGGIVTGRPVVMAGGRMTTAEPAGELPDETPKPTRTPRSR